MGNGKAVEMTVGEIGKVLGLATVAGAAGAGRPVTGGYVSDLLSDVIGNARPGFLWVTNQVHLNIVAVAVMANLAGVLVAGGNKPQPETVARAEKEGVALLTTGSPAFEVVGRLYEMGLRGRDEFSEAR